MSTRVIIVRHGQSTYNIEQRIQGRCDKSVLTDRGRSDAEKVGAALNGISFAAIYCSPLQRAKQTAEIARAGIGSDAPELQPSELLMEVDLPLWEEMTRDEVKEKFAAEYRQWQESPETFKMMLPNGQEHFPVLSLFEQAKQFWQETISKHPNETILVVAHNGINRCLISTAVGMTPDSYQVLQQTNCGISVLNFTGGFGETVQLESVNQTTHLGIPIPLPRRDRGLRLLLVRHGETQWNRESRFQGQIDIPLNETGKEQGARAAEFLKAIPIDFAITSSLSRPKETAQIILQHHPGVELAEADELVEIGHGLWEGKLEAEIRAEYDDLLNQWKQAPETVQMPEGENLQQVWDRANAYWAEIIKTHPSPEKVLTGLVAAHDAINKVILCAVLGLRPADIWSVKQGNGGVSAIDYPEGLAGKPVVQALNITSHLSGGVLDKTAAGAL